MRSVLKVATRVALACGLAASTMLTATAFADECLKRESHSAITFFLIDKSDKNTNVDQLAQSYDAVLEKIAPGERIVVGVSGEKQSDARIVIDAVKPTNSLWESVLKFRAREKTFATCIARGRSEIVHQDESHPHSAIMETLSFVANIINSDEATNGRRLVLLSDMIQNSPAVSFYTKGGLTTSGAMKTTEAKHLLVPLTGVSVLIAGVGSHSTDDKTRELEEFWKGYFDKAGAKLVFFGPTYLG